MPCVIIFPSLSNFFHVLQIVQVRNDPDYGHLFVINIKEYTPMWDNEAVREIQFCLYRRLRKHQEAIEKKNQEMKKRHQENAHIKIHQDNAKETRREGKAKCSPDSGIHGIGEGRGGVAGKPLKDPSNAEEEKMNMYQQGQKSEHVPKEIDVNSVASLVESDFCVAIEEETEKDTGNSSESGVHRVREGVEEVWVAGHPPKGTFAMNAFTLSNACWWILSQCHGTFLVLLSFVTLVCPHSPTNLDSRASISLHRVRMSL
jgi:hypothetical protein